MSVLEVSDSGLSETSEAESLIERVELVRKRLGLTMAALSSELNIPLQSYKGWRFGYRKLVPSQMLRSILNSEKLNCYFTYVLTGYKDGLPKQKSLPFSLAKTFEPYEGDRLHGIRKRLGLTRLQLVNKAGGIVAPTLKNYELMYRLRVPCHLYECLCKVEDIAPYIVFIVGGSKVRLDSQVSAVEG